MNRNIDVDTDSFVLLGVPVASIVESINPEAYAEFQLRQAVADAVKVIGKERTLTIIREEAA